jgi:hypothetical protein
VEKAVLTKKPRPRLGLLAWRQPLKRWNSPSTAGNSAYSSESNTPEAQDWPEVRRPIPSGRRTGYDRPLLGVHCGASGWTTGAAD